MKVFLDLSKLLHEGKITQAEYDKFSQLATQSTSSLAFNIFVGFGIVAVVGASLALIPTPYTAILLGLFVSMLGIGLLNYSEKWQVLAHMCVPIGALLLSGGILWFYEGSQTAWMIVTVMLLIGALIVRHALLMVLAVLALSCTIGAAADYYHATYTLSIQQPVLTILIFSALAYFAYWISQRLQDDYERLAIIAARTSIFLVNFGFWVGSLWGDELPRKLIIPDWVFALTWAIGLFGLAIWAVKNNRRFALNVATIFLAINFFTQWFERLGATPGTILIAGLLILFFAFCIKNMNLWFKTNKIS